MKTSYRLAAFVAFAGLAACGRPSPMSDDLKQDLEQASAAGVQFAPRSNRSAVVSAIELGESAKSSDLPKTSPVPRAPVRAKAPARTHRRPTVAHVAVAPARRQPTPVAQAPAPEPVIEAPAPAPMPIPAPSRVPSGRSSRGGRGGGWSTVGDVIRNAPFPINP